MDMNEFAKLGVPVARRFRCIRRSPRRKAGGGYQGDAPMMFGPFADPSAFGRDPPPAPMAHLGPNVNH